MRLRWRVVEFLALAALLTFFLVTLLCETLPPW
jgi:hypothetical protein